MVHGKVCLKNNTNVFFNTQKYIFFITNIIVLLYDCVFSEIQRIHIFYILNRTSMYVYAPYKFMIKLKYLEK